MICVLQRVSRASVRVAGEETGAIGAGLVLLACGMDGDDDRELAWLADKIADLRIVPGPDRGDERSVLEAGGAILLVSQFTLAAAWRKGRRPSYTGAAAPEAARGAVERLGARLRERGLRVAEGVFGAMMEVDLVNDGPFTLVLDSREAPHRRAGPEGASSP